MRRSNPLAVAVLAGAAVPAAGQVEFLDEPFDFDRAHPAAGFWLGNLQPQRFPDTWSALAIERDESGAWIASITIITALALDAPCAEIAIDGRSIAFTVPVRGGPRFEGTISPDGQRFEGAITFAQATDDQPEPGSFEFARMPRPTDLAQPLAYTGVLKVAGLPAIAMTFVFGETPGGHWVGHVDVPAQALTGFPLINVESDGVEIRAELPVAPFPASLAGTFDESKSRLTGTFTQGPYEIEIDFALDEAYAGPVLNRPQHPEPPYPYGVEDVTIVHPAGHILSGTLTVPVGDGPFAAVVLVTGSGAQDRDETIFGHKPFLVIADYLTRHGVAVLRYDDRGTAGSTGSFVTATTVDLATDVAAALDFLKTVEAVDVTRMGIIGHSEGAMIAPIVATTGGDVAFIVLLAGPGVRGDDLLRVQAELMLKASGADESMIARNRAQQEQFFTLIHDGADQDKLEAVLRPMLEAELGTAMGLEGEALDQMVDVQLQQYASPWMRYFVTYDPRPVLARVRCPVLALNGTLDLQVWHEQNLPEIEQAITGAGGDVTVRRYEGLNHLFQPATTGSIGEYGVIETTIDKAVLQDIAAWIELKTGS